MDWVAITYTGMFALMLLAGATYELSDLGQRVIATQAALLRTDLTQAAQQTAAQLAAAVQSRSVAVAGPYPASFTGSLPACGVAGASGPYCGDTVNYTSVATGAATASNQDLTLAGAGAPRTADNINVATDPSGQQIQGLAVYRITVSLVDLSSGHVLSTEHGTLTTTTLDMPPYAQIDSVQADAGAGDGGISPGLIVGQCPPGASNCAASGTGANAITGVDYAPDDTRIHAQLLCQDPNAGGSNPGDACTPSGQPTATPHPNDLYSQPTFNDGRNAPGGWMP